MMTQFEANRPANASNSVLAKVRNASRAFAREEDGALVAFGIFLFLMILMVGGIGVDVMHSEMKRTRLQHTLDRAILAAADLDQTRDPQAVVNDYFEKAQMTDYLADVTVNQGLNFREVSASASTTHATAFMRLVGVDTLEVPAAGTAEERIGNLEISLVLDVSGSMGSNSRLSNLKVAAKEFVQTMDDNTEDDTLSISIVPYSAQVALPDGVFDHMNVQGTNDFANCLNFSTSDFDDTGISHTTSYDRNMHFTWSSSKYDNRDNNPREEVDDGYQDCYTESSREVAILQNDTQELKDYIDDMFASGNTSIDMGMKWGTALIDPDFRPVIEKLVDQDENTDSGMVKKVFADRPYDYGTNDSLKIIVVMSDGQNTRQHHITDGNRDGDSPVWYNEQEDFYSIYLGQDVDDDDNDGDTDEPIYYWPSEEEFIDHAYGEGVYTTTETTYEWECTSYRKNGNCKKYKKIAQTVEVTVDEPGSAEVVTYPDLWAYTSPKYVAEEIFEPLLGYNTAMDAWYYDVIDEVSYGDKDDRTKQICDAAKLEGTIIFAIGFEAPDSARVVLKDCASSDSHYFDVDGLEIQDAFAAIATSIRQLRLTQ
ncbi:TadE/TadG family type IV pilus assembly protein [Shimia haliotis]|uniref:Flp pilus assembly protein TadG n=1 Tax=Shimia haliotis TaxID=1280847 RepID=A0A1I4A8M6_9RHOB|nr:TadE/TadG family type IV pilus assembly protein [Shimia haliotis]SFK52772.1 Flp pilus assembly protein TadG [Shimia haliotis]